MVPIQAVVPELVAGVIRKAPYSAEKLAFAWRMAVGPSVDRVTTIALERGVLRVRAKDAAWRREVERSAGIIRRRLESLLGPNMVRTLDVTLE